MCTPHPVAAFEQEIKTVNYLVLYTE